MLHSLDLEARQFIHSDSSRFTVVLHALTYTSTFRYSSNAPPHTRRTHLAPGLYHTTYTGTEYRCTDPNLRISSPPAPGQPPGIFRQHLRRHQAQQVCSTEFAATRLQDA